MGDRGEWGGTAAGRGSSATLSITEGQTLGSGGVQAL